MAEFSSALIIDTTDKFIQSMIEADLSLRLKCLQLYHAGGLIPVLPMVRGMRGKLSFILNVRKETGFFFNLFSEEREQSVADIRLNFGLRPMQEEPQITVGPLELTYAPPSFIEPDSMPDRLSIRLSSENIIQAKFPSADEVELKFDQAAPWRPVRDCPIDVLVDFFDTVTAWLRSQSSTNRLPFTIPTKTALGRLLQEIVDGCDHIFDRVQDYMQNPAIAMLDQGLTAIHSELGGDYGLDSLFVRVLVQLNGSGELLTDIDDRDWQQYDIEARLLRNMASHQVHFTMFPPDFLISGEYYRSFLQAIQRPGVIKKMYERLGTDTIHKTTFEQFIMNAGVDPAIIFVRINRDDTDLVLIQGNLQGSTVKLLYRIRFEVDKYPYVTVKKVVKVKLVSKNTGQGQWEGKRKLEREALKYLARFLRLLRVWERGLDRRRTG